MLTRLFDLFMDFANFGFRYILVPDNQDFFTGGKLTKDQDEKISIKSCALLICKA